MTTFNETQHAGGFMVSEANGTRSRATKVLAESQTLVAGAVLGTVTATGQVKELDPQAVDGSQVASGILWDAKTSGVGENPIVVVVARDAEVNAAELTYPVGITAGEITQALADLEALGIFAR